MGGCQAHSLIVLVLVVLVLVLVPVLLLLGRICLYNEHYLFRLHDEHLVSTLVIVIRPSVHLDGHFLLVT